MSTLSLHCQTVNISGGKFNSAQGDHNEYNIGRDLHIHDKEHGVDSLSKAASVDALHDAGARFPPPRCHPKTRKAVLNIITAWVEDPQSPHDIIWLHGPPGVGKTAIAQTIADWCCLEERREERYLAGSFFFARGKHGRDDGQHLFSTIAYQLALHVPGLRRHVNDAMCEDPTLPSKNIDIQLKTLIIEPFRKLSPPPERDYVVVIDGLDECKDPSMQRRILQLIASSFISRRLSLRFLIVSRSEVHIREAFEKPIFGQRTRRIVLDESFRPDRDIKTYLQHEFGEIAKREVLAPVLAHAAQPWPAKSVIDHFVKKASGQFSYAVTMIRFVGDEESLPHERLQALLNPSTTHKTFSNLDELYAQILDTYQDPTLLLRILPIMLALHCPQPPEVYDNILGVNPGYVAHTLRRMHSLIKFPNAAGDAQEREVFISRAEYDQTRGLRVRHISFRDFLLDSVHSDKYAVNLSEAHAAITRSGFRLYMDWISMEYVNRNECTPPSQETWGYLKNHLSIHFFECPEDDRRSVLEDLERFQPKLAATESTKDSAWDDAFAALYSLITTLAKMIKHNLMPWSFLSSGHSHWINESTSSMDSPSESDPVKDQIFGLYRKYCKILDDFYFRVLSPSDNIFKLLAAMPGYAMSKQPIPIEWLEDIFGANHDTVPAEVHTNTRFNYRWTSYDRMRYSNFAGGALEMASLNPHLTSFLFDPERSGEYYQDPQVMRIRACHDLIKTIFDVDWLRKERQAEILNFLQESLRQSLEDTNIDLSQDYSDSVDRHPVIGLIESFSSIAYDIPCLEQAPLLNVKLLWDATRKILHWIHRQMSKVKKTENPTRDFNQMFRDANDNIYRQILRVESIENGKRMIGFCSPFTVAATPPGQATEVESTDPSTIPAPPRLSQSRSNPNSNHISDVLLALHGVRYSLLEFLTREERAGALYIPKTTYHIQFAEICLRYCDPDHFDLTGDWRTLLAHTEWRFHLERAQPSALLLDQLCHIRPGPWLMQGESNKTTETKIKSVKAIIHWLENLSQNPSDILPRWRGLLRDISAENRKTLPRKRDLESLRRLASE